MAALAAARSPWAGAHDTVSMPETATMRPPPRASMSGTARWTAWRKPVTEMAKVRSTLWGACSSSGLRLVAAAFTTRMSSPPGPSSEAIQSNRASTESLSPAASSWTWAVPPASVIEAATPSASACCLR